MVINPGVWEESQVKSDQNQQEYYVNSRYEFKPAEPPENVSAFTLPLEYAASVRVRSRRVGKQ